MRFPIAAKLAAMLLVLLAALLVVGFAGLRGLNDLRGQTTSLYQDHTVTLQREAISKITVPGVERSITGSLGVAILPLDAGDAATLIRHADRALYTAKRNGRNRVEGLLWSEPFPFELEPATSTEEPTPA